VSRQYYNLPSLNALATFEAVARHQSLTLAANELGVTPGAVSRQIKLLETEIGNELLVRQHKKVYCNQNGQLLYESLRLCFSNLSKTINEFSKNDDAFTFSLGSTTAFSSLWLMPRLSQFWKKYPHVHINHILSDKNDDSSYDSVDINIRYGLEKLKKYDSTQLFADEIYPVCSPKLAKKYKNIDSPSQLIKLPLLQLHHDDKTWTDWRQWLSHFKITSPLNNVSSYNNYIIALQAAQDSQGILLGWDRLVQPLINEGKLTRILKVSYKSPGAYYLYLNKKKKLNTGSTLFVKWLTSVNSLD